MRIHKQKGTALIMAIFIMTIVATIAITLVSQLHRNIHRTDLLLNSIKANLYAEGAILEAEEVLKNNLAKHRPNELTDRLPINLGTKKINQFTIVTTIEDAQGNFNLNNLTHPESQEQLARLIKLIDPEIRASRITKSITNWISTSVQNIEDDVFYSKLEPAYRAAHRPMVDSSEIRMVRGINADNYVKILPYVTALPEGALININTASLPVLQSLSQSMSADAARNIIELRKSTPFITSDQFLNLDIVKNHNIDKNKITAQSKYFLAHIKVTQPGQTLMMHVLIERNFQDNKPVTSILWQSKGAL